MNNSAICDAENEIFERWKAARCEYDSFDEDGVIDPKIWMATNPKILFVLKETNRLNGDLRKFLRDGGSPTYHYTWNSIVRWAETILYGKWPFKFPKHE